jgi:N-acetylglucosaminyldiphosphoundecaprenol N-acetyl-beta-D-mannosaminyltransferase
VTPDGVSVLAAVSYEKRVAQIGGWLGKLAMGLKVGRDVLAGRLGETVTGVWLFEELCREAGKKRLKVFLLGGWGGVAERASVILLERFPGIKVAYDPGESRAGTDGSIDRRVVERINRFKPDILFVAYSPVVQEKWIDAHREVLKAKVAIGVGGTFDEYAGKLALAPEWMSRSGLKWLWRLWLQPKRLRRILRAVIVFPWLVYKGSLKKN